MRYLANENFPGAAGRILRAAGHDVVWVRTDAPGAKDTDVLAWAAREFRVLLTFDKDFGDLARRSSLPAQSGVILFRIPMPRPGEAGLAVAARITSRGDWVDHFSVVEHGRVRLRPLFRII